MARVPLSRFETNLLGKRVTPLHPKSEYQDFQPYWWKPSENVPHATITAVWVDESKIFVNITEPGGRSSSGVLLEGLRVEVLEEPTDACDVCKTLRPHGYLVPIGDGRMACPRCTQGR